MTVWRMVMVSSRMARSAGRASLRSAVPASAGAADGPVGSGGGGEQGRGSADGGGERGDERGEVAAYGGEEFSGGGDGAVQRGAAGVFVGEVERPAALAAEIVVRAGWFGAAGAGGIGHRAGV